MTNIYVVRNQDGLFADKHKEWVDGREPKLLFRCAHRDEAINLVFELSSKDIYLRAEAIQVPLGEKKQPEVEVTAPLPVEAEAEDDQTEESEQPSEIQQADTESLLDSSDTETITDTDTDTDFESETAVADPELVAE